jgi:peptidoglycan/LPS O-acetylase OafA/YrhL
MRFRALDGWRGLCALLVAVYHLNVASHFFLTALRIGSSVFVDFFFVLSGFVMAHGYALRPMRSEGAVSFVVRRFGRVWPLHAFVLAVLVAMEAAKIVAGDPSSGYRPFGIDAVSPWSIVTNLLLIQALDLHPTLTWNFVSWSISAEFWAYIIFVTALLALTQRWLTHGFLALSLLCGLLLIRAPLGMDSVYDFALPRCAYGFFAGCFLRMILPSRPIAIGWTAATLAEVAAVAGALAFVCFGTHTQASFAAPLVFGILIMVFAREGGAVSRLLTRPPVQALGQWSYSIYLVHILVLALVGRMKMLEHWTHVPVATMRHFPFAAEPLLIYDLGSPWIMDGVTLAYVAMLIAAARFTDRLIERPGQKLFNRLAKHLSTRPVGAEGGALPAGGDRRASI